MDNKALTSTVEAVRRGERRVVGQALTQVENQLPGAEALTDALYPHVGSAWRIGITGPPGAGKSTLTNELIKIFREQNQSVGVIAADPTSAFTGGALLGDRIRMNRYYNDQGVFIRSVASRGASGGLGPQTDAMADVLDAAGFDVLLIETVGVGQGEISIAAAADTTVVVLVPESGDSIQAMKAGLMEIADIFCVNKADHPEADQLARILTNTLRASSSPDKKKSWSPPVVKTVALQPDTLPALTKALRKHKTYLKESSRWDEQRVRRLRMRVHQLVQEAWERRFWTSERKTQLDKAIETLDSSVRTPHALAQRLLNSFTSPNESS